MTAAQRLGSLALAIGLAAAPARTPITPDALAQGRPGGPGSGLPPTTIADTIPPPPGVPNLAWLSSIEIAPAPADSLRRAFMSAFRGAFAEGAYATERERDGRPAASVPVSARFRLIEGTSGWGVWDVRVVVEPAARGSANDPAEFQVLVAVLSPQSAEAGARPIPLRTGIAIDAAHPGADAAGRPGPRARSSTEIWRDAGRATALLALEGLHHLSGDLDEDTRLGLGPARRLPARGASERPKR